MKFYFFLLMAALSPYVFSATVVYTDYLHPPSSLTPQTQVVYLDAPQQISNSMFGTVSADPVQAQHQAQEIISSPDWQQKQNELIKAWQGVITAWHLGVKKYPAIVFDEQEVVYGTADVMRASELRQKVTPHE